MHKIAQKWSIPCSDSRALSFYVRALKQQLQLWAWFQVRASYPYQALAQQVPIQRQHGHGENLDFKHQNKGRCIFIKAAQDSLTILRSQRLPPAALIPTTNLWQSCCVHFGDAASEGPCLSMLHAFAKQGAVHMSPLALSLVQVSIPQPRQHWISACAHTIQPASSVGGFVFLPHEDFVLAWTLRRSFLASVGWLGQWPQGPPNFHQFPNSLPCLIHHTQFDLSLHVLIACTTSGSGVSWCRGDFHGLFTTQFGYGGVLIITGLNWWPVFANLLCLQHQPFSLFFACFQ